MGIGVDLAKSIYIWMVLEGRKDSPSPRMVILVQSTYTSVAICQLTVSFPGPQTLQVDFFSYQFLTISERNQKPREAN